MNTKALVNLARMEADIGAIEFAQPHHRETELPSYVTPTEGVPKVGALSAGAVLQMYEQAALSWDALGKVCQEIAQNCRDAGKRQFTAIEEHALLAQSIRETCDAMAKKVMAHTGEDR